jgi:hypothetical protein
MLRLFLFLFLHVFLHYLLYDAEFTIMQCNSETRKREGGVLFGVITHNHSLA